MLNVAPYSDDDALLDTLTFLAIQGYLCFKRHFLQCYLHDIFTALWQQSMKSSADIKFYFYSVKTPLSHLIVCSWWSWWYFYLHSVTYQQSRNHTAGAAVISYQYTPSLQICANLCTEQTDRDETTCFSYSYSASHQMCYLSSDLSLNAGETTYTIKGKEFIYSLDLP